MEFIVKTQLAQSCGQVDKICKSFMLKVLCMLKWRLPRSQSRGKGLYGASFVDSSWDDMNHSTEMPSLPW